MPVFRYVDPTEATQKHWKLHSTVRHAVAMFQHSKWNSEGAGLEDSSGAYLLIWRQSEDVSIEMVPESGCHNIDFHSIL
eukprot:319120-Amphidinium_carterae.1